MKSLFCINNTQSKFETLTEATKIKGAIGQSQDMNVKV
jgi:hypothetical protein